MPNSTDSLIRPSVLDSDVRDFLPATKAAEEALDSVDISTEVVDSIASSVAFDPVGHLDGVAPEPLIREGHFSSVIMALVLALFVGAGCSPASLKRALAHYRGELLSVRRRKNAFDDDSSQGLPLMRGYLVVGSVVIIGVAAGLLFGAANLWGILGGVMLTAAFAVFDYVAYSLVGYTFAAKEVRRRWIGGYAASVVFSAVYMFVPLVAAMVFPQFSKWLLMACGAIFIVFRLIYIYKGIRIFFEGIGSLLYFILYLCTLEIIPLLALVMYGSTVVGFTQTAMAGYGF